MKYSVAYTWFDTKGVSEELDNLLNEHAQERIRDMSKEGYTSGQLVYETDENTYTGYWSIEKHEEL